MQINKERLIDRIAYWLLCIIVFDCAAFGGGSIIKVFGIDFRMVLFALFFLASLPALFRSLKEIFSNGYFLLLLLWGVWLIVSTVRGIQAGNRLDTIISAWIGFASFGILPGALAVLKDKERILCLMKVACVASAVLMLQIFAALIIYNIDLHAFISTNYLMIEKELGGCTGVNDSVVRIFFRSHPFLVFGCACSLYFSLTEERKGIRMLHCVNIALSLFGLVVSYTRSIYLCVFACVFVVVAMFAAVMGREGSRRLLKSIRNAVGVFLIVLLVCDLVFGGLYLSYAVDRTLGVNFMSHAETVLGIDNNRRQSENLDEEPDALDPENEALVQDPEVNAAESTLDIWSDNVRGETVNQLRKGIKMHPVVGSGMGASLSNRGDGYNEYFFLDQLYKTGLIGLLLYIAPILLLVFFGVAYLKKMEKEDAMICAVWLASLLGFVVFSFFNPYLNGSNGITLYCCTLCVFSALNGKQQIKLKRK